jgi:hypothetical protein
MSDSNCSLRSNEPPVDNMYSSATKGEITRFSHRSHHNFHFARLPNMINHQAISCEAQLPSPGHSNAYDFDLMTASMGGETITSVAFLQQSLLLTNPRSTLAGAPLYQPDQPSLMSLQGGGALGLPSLSSWPTQSGGVPSLLHGSETASSLPASLARIRTILDEVLTILDADDSVIARIANTSDTHVGDDDPQMLAFSSCFRNMPPARQ